MNFQSVNPLNIRINVLSGNLLPVAPGDSRFPIILKLYSAFVWLIQVIQTITLIPGMVLVSREKALKDGLLSSVVLMEIFFMALRIHSHRKLMSQLIQRLNDILAVADETMKNIVTSTLKPMEEPLRFYWLAGGLAVLVWHSIPFLLVFERNYFFYEDYSVPIAFSKQPFQIDIFLLGNGIVLFGSMIMFIKKVGLDVYMIHLVLLTTAQYRYIATKLATIFQHGNPRDKFNDFRQEYITGTNQWVEREMRAICRHHNAVIHLLLMLKKLLSLNFSMIYINNVLRFCFIGILMSAIPSMTFVESFLVIMFSIASIVQFYMLCFCVQQLDDASAKMTSEAFQEKWYQFGYSIKRTFMIIILSNNLECKLSSCDKFNLSLPSFMTILNQSYSICLLLLRTK